MMARFHHFLKDRRGATGVEFAMVFLVFFGAIIAITDFSRALWIYNEAVKACQVGARFAVVNDMIPADLMTWSGVLDASPSITAGDPIPISEFPTPIVCPGADCSSLGYDSDAYDAIVAEMSGHFNSLATDPSAVVTVTYEHIGLGFSGNPLGPDIWPLVTVEISGMTFNFFTPLINLADLQFPRCSASLTGEDYVTCLPFDQTGTLSDQPPC